MATPVLRAVREALPAARILGVMRRGLDDVLRGNRWLDETIVCDMKGLAGPLRLANAISRFNAQAVLLLPNSFRAALGARLSGASIRVGYDRDRRGWLLSHRLNTVIQPPNLPIPMVLYYAALAEFALGRGGKPIDRRIELMVTSDEEHAADQPLHDVRHLFVVLNPGANRSDKRWPAERFAAVADALASSHGLAAVVNGSAGEREIVQSVMRAAKSPIINLTERGITLGSLKAVIGRAALMITNDTGPRHIAAALGTPVVTLLGPTDHRWTTLHCSHEHLLLAEPFLPEQLSADQHARACAIEKISVADVIAAAGALLEKSKAQLAARAD